MRLIAFHQEHFSTIADWFSSQVEVVQWGGPTVTYPLTTEQCQSMLAEGQEQPPSRLCWMAEHEGGLVGHAQVGLDWRNGNALLSRVAIAPWARGRKLAEPMLRLILEKVECYPQMQRIELNVYSWNAAAVRLYARLGFVVEGTRRASTKVGNERWDTIIMAMLREGKSSFTTSH